jgi:hypothetical protein
LVLALAAVTLAVVAACGGGDSEVALTLDQYFPRVQVLLEEQETRADAVGERYTSQLDARATSLDEALAAALPVLPVMLAALRPATVDLLTGLEDIVPPREAEDTHGALVRGYQEMLTLMDDLVARLERGEGGVEAFAVMFADASGTALGQRLTTALSDLEELAEASGIAVDLGAGGAQASGRNGGAGGAPGPRVIPPEPTDPLQPPGSPSGISEIDAVVEAVLAGDLEATLARIRLTSTPCTTAGGIGGPPKCSSTTTEDASGKRQVFTEEDGEVVDVLPFSVCEGEYARAEEIEPVIARLVLPEGAVVERVYAVYRVPDDEFQAAYWPAGEYAVVIANRTNSGLSGTTVRIGARGIVRIDFGCGPVPPASMSVGHTDHLLVESLGGLSLAGLTRTVEAVTRASPTAARGTDGPLTTVVELADPIGGYYSVLIDERTELEWADGTAASPDSLEVGQLVEVAGAPLPWSLLLAQRILIMPSTP